MGTGLALATDVSSAPLSCFSLAMDCLYPRDPPQPVRVRRKKTIPLRWLRFIGKHLCIAGDLYMVSFGWLGLSLLVFGPVRTQEDSFFRLLESQTQRCIFVLLVLDTFAMHSACVLRLAFVLLQLQPFSEEVSSDLIISTAAAIARELG